MVISYKPSHGTHPTSHFTLCGWGWAGGPPGSRLRSEICRPWSQIVRHSCGQGCRWYVRCRDIGGRGGRNRWGGAGVGCSLHHSDLPCVGTLSKKGFGCERGLTLTFHGSLPCSHAITSPCRAVLGPSLIFLHLVHPTYGPPQLSRGSDRCTTVLLRSWGRPYVVSLINMHEVWVW